MTEFSHYRYEWADPYGPLATLHQVNPLRIQFVEEQIKLANLTRNIGEAAIDVAVWLSL